MGKRDTAPRVASRGLLALATAFLLGAVPAASGAVEAARVKAAFLYNFAKFVEWPEEALAEGAPLELCVLADAATEEQIRATVEGKKAQGHPIRARAIEGADEVPGCHIVYVAAASGISPGDLASAVAGRSVLTVGETEGFSRRGGMIRLLQKGGKLRFAVNPSVAEHAGLGISSKLLRLAQVVRE